MNPVVRDPLLPPTGGEDRPGFEECERCGAVIARRAATKHLNWHDALAGALRARPAAKR